MQRRSGYLKLESRVTARLCRFRLQGNGGVRTGPAVIWAATLLLTLPVRAAVISNVGSWSQDGQEVTFNIIDGSKVRVGILAADLARIRIAPNGVFGANVSRAVVKSSWTAAAYTAVDGGSDVTITTAAMKLVISKNPFTLTCRDLDDTLVLADDPSRRIQWDTGWTRVYKTTQPGESYVGLGWRTHGLVRNGTRFVMDNVPNYSSPDTFYSGVPLWHGLRNGRAYGVFLDDTSWGRIDLTTTGTGYMSFQNTGGMLDYYYFAGPSLAGILDRYTELTGRPYMPPRWSLGYQQSRWSYTPQSQVLDIANQFRARGIPCDVLYLDIDYMPGGRALSFNSDTFPDPAAMLATLHAQGFHVVANISPFLFVDDPKYPAAQANNCLLRKANGQIHNGWHDYWYFVGGAGTGSLAWLDFSRTTARNWWAAQHAPFLAYGIDGIWNDLNEPDELGGAWPSDLKHYFDGDLVDHSKTSTQYALLQTELSYHILAAQYPDRRPFVLSRGGYAGIQRCATLWSGDNTSHWTNDYRRNIPMGLSMSISGNPHNGHDIGGFFGWPDFNDPPSAELYTRWMQAGVFSPFCRQHHDGEGNHDPDRPFVEPWRFGTTVESICRDFIGLRYRLMPYLYTLFHQAHTTGAPVQRPTLYDFPGDPNTLGQDYDFMVGPSLLVSPVTTAGATTWATYLPAGADWIDWWDDTLHVGGQTVVTATPLERLPIFVRQGAIIPMGPVMQYAGEVPAPALTLRIYPGTNETTYTLYEDDGISWDYQSGGFATTTYTVSPAGDELTLDIAARAGGYDPGARTCTLEIHTWSNAGSFVLVDNCVLTRHPSRSAFDAAATGCYYDSTGDVMWARFRDSGQPMRVALRNAFEFTTCTGGGLPGDYDYDGDVDQDDIVLFQACISSPAVLLAPGCENKNFDGDNDVDQDDWGKVQRCLSGMNIPGDPSCAD